MAEQTFIFALADGTQEKVWGGSPRYRELIADGLTPVGTVPASDGISAKLKTFLQGLVDVSSTAAQAAADAAAASAQEAADAAASIGQGGGSTATVATITVPAGAVSAPLTGFPVRVNLADLGDSFWTHLTPGGGNVRVASSTGTDLPFDLVHIDTTARTGELFFRADLTGAEQSFTIGGRAGAAPLLATDPLGRNAVWADFDAMFAFPSTVNRVGNGDDAVQVGSLTQGQAPQPGPVSPNVNAHEGLALDGAGFFYVIGVDDITKYDPQWRQVTQATGIAAATGIAGINHLGDGCVVGDELFIEVETWPSGPYTNQHVVVFDTGTLAIKRTYDLSAQATSFGAIAYNTADECFYLPSYVAGGERTLWKYDAAFNFVGTVTLASGVSAKQGIDYHAGYFYVSCDAGQLWRIKADGSTLELLHDDALMPSMEGVTVGPDGTVYVLWDDRASLTSYVYAYPPATDGWARFAKRGRYQATVPKRTTWTMGASVIPDNTSIGTVMSYGAAGSGDNTVRTTLAQHSSTAKWSTWNSAQSWLDGTTPVEVGVPRRLHLVQTATTSRTLWVDGAQEATGPTAQRPGGTGDMLYIGAEDTDAAEAISAALNYCYLRNAALSADWLAAEHASWSGGAFYTVTA